MGRHKSEKPKYERVKENNRKRLDKVDTTPMDNISRVVCDVFEVSFEEIKGDKKPRKYVIARQTIAYFLKFDKRNYPLLVIALYLGYQEHAVVSHGIETVKNTLLLYNDYKVKFNMIEGRIKDSDFIQHTWERRQSLLELNNFY
jgi:chromosomal replication initiation ATPase DnaA